MSRRKVFEQVWNFGFGVPASAGPARDVPRRMDGSGVWPAATGTQTLSMNRFFFSLSPIGGENSPNEGSRFEPMSRGDLASKTSENSPSPIGWERAGVRVHGEDWGEGAPRFMGAKRGMSFGAILSQPRRGAFSNTLALVLLAAGVLAGIFHMRFGFSEGPLINTPLQRGVGRREQTVNRLNGFAQGGPPVMPSPSAGQAGPAQPDRPFATTNQLSPAVPIENAKPAVPARTFTSQDIFLPEYAAYLMSLRAAGCPEKHLRQIVLSDVNDYFDQQRLRQALASDFEWWKTGTTPQPMMAMAASELASLEGGREALLNRLLGTNEANGGQSAPILAGLMFNLTGPVLGAMSLDKFNAVVEVCRQAQERMRDYQLSRFSQGLTLEAVEEARLRQQTRAELAPLLTPAEMEEFLLRNSHNAETLRQNLRTFNPSREEFQKIFRVLDPIQAQMQFDYGTQTALSPRQRDEYERQCHRAVQEVLPPARFKAYLMTQDPTYLRAQTQAAPAALDEASVQRLYEFYRAQAVKRAKVQADSSLPVEQKRQAMQDIAKEEQSFLSELVRGKTNRP